MRRVCVVLPSHWSGSNGGAELQAKYVVDALVAAGRYEVTYVTRRVAPGFSPPGYRVAQVARGKGSLLNGVIGAYRALKALRPDAIYQRVGGVYTGVSAAYCRHHHCRLVWHIASDAELAPGVGGLSLDVPLGSYLERYLLHYGIRNASAIIAQTQTQARMLTKNHGRIPAAFVPNFHPAVGAEIAGKDERVTVVWVANLKRIKRPEVFVRLAARLRDSGARFVMVGRPEVEPSVMREVERTGNLEYLGELTQEEVFQLLQRSHVLVNTSDYEGFPNTFIQAWMRGVAVVSLSVDPDGVLADKGMGVLAGSEERLHDVVAALIKRADWRDELARKARCHAMEVHSLDNVQRVLAVLDGTGDQSVAAVCHP